eukprot:COSAG02_NODE_95_length_37416_cov_60.512742_14_plen_831_part_00
MVEFGVGVRRVGSVGRLCPLCVRSLPNHAPLPWTAARTERWVHVEYCARGEMAVVPQLRLVVAIVGALAWAAPAQAQVEFCSEVVCGNPVYVVNREMHDLSVAEANSSVTADKCTDFVNATGAILWEDCACGCGAAHRVMIYILGVLIIFYSIVVLLFVTGIKILRAGPRREYEDLKAAGKVREDTEEIGGDAARAWMSKSEDEVRTDCGLDAAVYLLHCRQCAMFWLGQGMTMGLVLLMTYKLGGDYEKGITVFAFSSANLAPTNPAKWLSVLAQFWFVGSTVGFTMWKQKGMDSYKLEAEEEGGRHTSLNTVWIANVSTGATEDKLKSWFDSEYAGEVLEAKMVWDVNALGHNIRSRRRLIQKINALYSKKADADDDGAVAKMQLKIDALTVKVKDLEQWEKPLRDRPLTGAGSAFVTFKTEEQCQAFRKSLGDKQRGASSGDAAALAVSKWSAVMAPRSVEIYWENFGLEASDKLNNQAKAWGLTIVMFLLFLLAALGAFWVLGFMYMELLYWVYPTPDVGEKHDAMRNAVGPVVWYGVFGLFFVILFLGLEEEMSPIVKYICKFEYPYTKSLKQSSYLGKIYWFYMIYHVALSTVLLGVLALWCDIRNIPVVDGGCEETLGETDADGAKCRNGRYQLYVESVGAFHQNRLYLTACVIDFLQTLGGLSYFSRKAHTLDDEELSKFESAEDEEDEEFALEDEADKFFSDKFDYTRNYAESIAVFTSICVYSTMHPTMMILGSSYYGIKYYVDKYQITNLYSKPHVQYGRRARTTTIYILWAQTIAQWLNAANHLILTQDYAVGGAMTFSAVIMQVVIILYVYQPETLK